MEGMTVVEMAEEHQEVGDISILIEKEMLIFIFYFFYSLKLDSVTSFVH